MVKDGGDTWLDSWLWIWVFGLGVLLLAGTCLLGWLCSRALALGWKEGIGLGCWLALCWEMKCPLWLAL